LYYDREKGKSIVGGPTKEHSYPGNQAFISGSSQARYMIWDGIRAIDYLLTRKEVDSARLGITGRSGGGTQSSYIAAFDDRI
jgi:dienelactone hydrolase